MRPSPTIPPEALSSLWHVIYPRRHPLDVPAADRVTPRADLPEPLRVMQAAVALSFAAWTTADAALAEDREDSALRQETELLLLAWIAIESDTRQRLDQWEQEHPVPPDCEVI